MTVLSSSCLQEALPGLIWDLGQQLGDLSLESGGLEQESGRSSGEHGGRGKGRPDTQMFSTALHLSGCPVSASRSPCLPIPGFPSQAGPMIVSPFFPGIQASMKTPAPQEVPTHHPQPSVGTVASLDLAPMDAWVPLNPGASMPAKGPSP